MARMLTTGMGVRNVAKVLEISKTTVLNFVKSFLDAIPEIDLLPHDTYDVDEQFVRVGKKVPGLQHWVMYAISHTTKEVVTLQVGVRNKENLASVIRPLLRSHPRKIITDLLPTFKTIVPQAIHKRGQRANQIIERQNLNNRKDAARLGRKSICYSKSLKMLFAHLRLYFWFRQDYFERELVF